jgi:hypothetical protein
MIYVSIDLETSGLDAENCQILEFGAVLEDTNNILPLEDLPQFHCYLKHPGGNISGNIFALNLNAGIIANLKNEKDLKDKYQYLKPDELADAFLAWLKIQGLEIKEKNGKFYTTITVAGKNFAGFDRKFLDKIPNFSKKIRMRQRTLDPAILFLDWKLDDAPPSLDECKVKAGIEGVVTHLAVDDAMDVIKLLRKSYE